MMRPVLGALGLVAAVTLLTSPAPVGATPPSEVHIEAATLIDGSAVPFEASGSAVDDGVLCEEGMVADGSSKAVGFTVNGFNIQVIKRFTCGDGSGEFFVNLQARFDASDLSVTFHWNVLGGTGDYVALHGAGSGIGLPGVPCGDEFACVFDVYDGAVHID